MNTVQTTGCCGLCQGDGELLFGQADRFMRVHPDTTHDVYRCRRCGVLFVVSGDLDRLGDYYPAEYYEGGHQSGALGTLARLRVRNRARSAEWRASKGGSSMSAVVVEHSSPR